MAFTTATEVRSSTDKFTDTDDVPNTLLENRISEASDILISDLSGIVSEDDLVSMGSGSKVLNQLATYKSVEISLVRLYGASRQADVITDVQYWEKRYNELLGKVLNGDVEITDGTDVLSATSIPVATANSKNAKMYPEKGVSGFTNDGAKTDTVEDPVK